MTELAIGLWSLQLRLTCGGMGLGTDRSPQSSRQKSFEALCRDLLRERPFLDLRLACVVTFVILEEFLRRHLSDSLTQGSDLAMGASEG